LRLTAGHNQVNHSANVLKNIEGLGCRILKPTDAQGKNWVVVVDGTTDIPYPPFFQPAWITEDPEQFRIRQVDSTHIIVRAGTWAYNTRAGDGSATTIGGNPYGQVVASGGAGTIQWASTADYNDWSDAYEITESANIWLKYDRTSTPGGTLTCVVLAAATPPTPGARIDWLQIGYIGFAGSAITGVYQIADDCQYGVTPASSSFAMTKAGALTSSGAVTFDSAVYNTNTHWLAPHAGLAKVDVNQSGVYHVSLAAFCGATATAAATPVAVSVAVRIDGAATYCAVGAGAGWLQSSASVTQIANSVQAGSSMDIIISAGSYIDVYVTKSGTGDVSAALFRLSGHLVHPV